MTLEFESPEYAGRFREVIERIVIGVINNQRPDTRMGRVFSFDLGSQTAQILFSGETIDNLVKVSVANNMWPTTVMETFFDELGYESPGDLVRVTGKPGALFVVDYYRGGPNSAEILTDDIVQKAVEEVGDITPGPAGLPEFSPEIEVIEIPISRGFLLQIPQPDVWDTVKIEASINLDFTTINATVFTRTSNVIIAPLEISTDYYLRAQSFNLLGNADYGPTTGPRRILTVEPVDIPEISEAIQQAQEAIDRLGSTRHIVY